MPAHSFDAQEAVDYGLEEAIMIWNLRFWIIKNKANNKHQYAGEDGVLRTWTYNTNEAFQKLFPYWKKGAIERNLGRMVEKKIIIKGNFNSTKYDRTSWFAFFDEVEFLAPHLVIGHFSETGNANLDSEESKSRKQKMESSETGNSKIGNGKYNTNLKPDIKQFLSLPSEEKKEFLKKVFEEKNLRSSFEKYFIFREKQNWKGLSNLDADIAWWENGFNEKNPIVSKIETVDDKEISGIRRIIKMSLPLFVDYEKYFAGQPIEKSGDEFIIKVSDKKALEYQEILSKLKIVIEVK